MSTEFVHFERIHTGARMNIPWKGRSGSRKRSTSKSASNDSTYLRDDGGDYYYL